jgi:hypothetical protein
MRTITLTALLALAFAVTSSGVAQATYIIDDPGNPSDGLRFLNMTYSDGLSLADALANAVATYADARLATPDEWDDLFAAAGVVYSGTETASAAFGTGDSTLLVSIGVGGGIALYTALGPTIGTSVLIWSDPDGDASGLSTRDYMAIEDVGAAVLWQNDNTPTPHNSLGWLLVSEVPEPSTVSMLALGALAFGLRGRRAAVR